MPLPRHFDLLPGLQPNQEGLWLPATGLPVPEGSSIGALLAEDPAFPGKTPNLPAAGPGASWFVSATGSWPIG